MDHELLLARSITQAQHMVRTLGGCGTLRLSASFFNTEDQADRLVWALSRVLRENVEL